MIVKESMVKKWVGTLNSLSMHAVVTATHTKLFLA